MQDLEKLKSILKALRNPETGCPWDRVQTFASIAPNTVEEAYEVLEAVETGNTDGLKEEIGDLLLHVLFYSDIAKEQGLFTFDDVVDALCTKLISRHPHVFGGADRASNADEALASWEKVKAKERKEVKKMTGALDGIAVTLPASTVAYKLQKRAARVGVDKSKRATFADLNKAIGAFKTCEDEQTLGASLFALIAAARKAGLNPDTALRKYNRSFKSAFNKAEQVKKV